jgi:hypothetical protein
VPGATPVTKPVVETVAIVELSETHGFELAAVPVPKSWVVNAGHTEVVPDIIGATNCAATLNEALARDGQLPLLVVTL